MGIGVKDVVDAVFSFPGYPRLESAAVVRTAIIKGVAEGVFAYSGRGELPLSGRIGERGPLYQVGQGQITLNRHMTEDEVDLEDGFLILPQAIPDEKKPEVAVSTQQTNQTGEEQTTAKKTDDTSTTDAGTDEKKVVTQNRQAAITLRVKLTPQQLFSSFKAIGNLAEAAGEITVTIEANKSDGFDKVWLRNALYEPLEEAGIDS